MKKILIIYAQTGGGHLSLALALEQALRQFSILNFQFSISLFDPFPKIYTSGYKTVGANFQESWGKNFHLTNRPELAKVMHNLNDAVVGRKLIKIIKKENPDVVITTHFFAGVELEKAIKKVGSRAKIVVAVADPFTPHAVWFTYKNADLYLSPTKEVTQLMVENGIKEERIKTTGWLVRKEFREGVDSDSNLKFEIQNLKSNPNVSNIENCDNENSIQIENCKLKIKEEKVRTLRRILGLDEDKFTIFIGGSGQGGGKILELVKQILNSQLLTFNSQLIIVAGQNRQLMTKLMKLAEPNPQFFHPFPYVNNVRQLMAVSDVVVGKAGPNILFESIFMLKPFLATGCLPGQEEGNLEFIKRENLGWVIDKPEEAVKFLEKLSSSNSLNPPSLASTSHASRGGPISLITPNLIRVRNEHLNGAKNSALEIGKLLGISKEVI